MSVPWNKCGTGVGAPGWDEPSLSVQEFHRQFQMRGSKHRDTAWSSASTFEPADSDSGSSESAYLGIPPPPGLERVPMTSLAAAPPLAPTEANPLTEGLRQTVVQMTDGMCHQRPWFPSPAPALGVLPAAEAEEPPLATSDELRCSKQAAQREGPRSYGKSHGYQGNERNWQSGRRQNRPRDVKRTGAVGAEAKALSYQHNFTVVFHGYDKEKHSNFELVQRLIGRGGCNMKAIYAGKPVSARVTGSEGPDMVLLTVKCQSEELMKDTSPVSMPSTGISPFALSDLSPGLTASPAVSVEEPMAPSPRLSLQLPSPGTLGHPEVCRRPCMHFQLGHCMNGSDCNFCHAAHPEKAAKLDKKQRMLLQTLSNREFSAMILQYVQQRLEPASETAKVAAADLIECLREKTGEASLPTLLEREQKNLQKTFARMNVSNLIGVLTHKFSKSDEDSYVPRISAAMEKLRWHFLTEDI